MTGTTGGPGRKSDVNREGDATELTPGRAFARSASGVFLTRVLLFGLTITSTYLMARLLGTSGRGLYALVSAYAGLIFVLSQLGLPSAFTYFTARGFPVKALRRLGILLVTLIAAFVIAIGLATMPGLQSHGLPLQGVPTDLALLALVLVPLQLLSSVTGSILYGLKRFRRYNLIQITQATALVVLVAFLVGPLHLGVPGAVLAVIGSWAVGSVLVLREVAIAARSGSDRPLTDQEAGSSSGGGTVPESSRQAPSRAREVVGYALRLYPSLVPSYFSYRQDVLLLGAFAVPASEIGLYGVAVNFAEMLFYIPDSISTVLYPTLAGSSRHDADRRAISVTRFTVLATVLAALVLIPGAYVALRVLLPDFVGSMVPFLIILPAVVSLTVSKVLSTYVAGLGRPGPVTVAAIVSMLVNLGANLVLIPRLGIVGASAASLISYTTQALLLLAIASRAAHRPPWTFITPGRAEVSQLVRAPAFVWSAVRDASRRRASGESAR